MDCEHIVKTSTLIIRTLHIDAGCAVTVAVGPVYIYICIQALQIFVRTCMLYRTDGLIIIAESHNTNHHIFKSW